MGLNMQCNTLNLTNRIKMKINYVDRPKYTEKIVSACKHYYILHTMQAEVIGWYYLIYKRVSGKGCS
jgi:hypothetical protein